jgi:hypothetical protein
VMTCPLGGCTDAGPTTLVPGSYYRVLKLDRANIYWTGGATIDSGTVFQCPLAGCSQPTVLASSQASPFGIAVDSLDVYWTTDVPNGGVFRCAIGGCGGSPTTLVTGQPAPDAIVVDSANIYWANNGGDVMECAKSACSTTLITLASSQGSASSNNMAVDRTNVYWINGSAIMRCAIGGCGANPTVAVQGFNLINSFAIDATTIYWTDAYTTSSTTEFSDVFESPK